MATSTSPSKTTIVRRLYRDLFHQISQQQKQPVKSSKTKIGDQSTKQQLLTELRTEFREPLRQNETVEDRIRLGESKLSFLRITSNHVRSRGNRNSGEKNAIQKWVYKDGKRLEDSGDGTIRDGNNGRVISPYDGKNLDPQAVTRHKKSLRRAGFVNNQHAKGFF